MNGPSREEFDANNDALNGRIDELRASTKEMIDALKANLEAIVARMAARMEPRRRPSLSLSSPPR